MINENQVFRAVLIAVGAVLVLWALVIIVNLIINYCKESKKAKEIIDKEKLKMEMLANNNSANLQNNMQFAYAEPNNLNSQYPQNANSFYAAVGHFTDTGRSQSRTGYYSENRTDKLFNDRNFVIIKSVICTETRDEID